MNTTVVLSIAAVAALLSGCQDAPPVPEADFTAPLPAIAAHFRQTETGGAGAMQEWRFWREPTLLVTDNLTDGSSDRWQRDGNTIFHQKLFHDVRSGVEFQLDDLTMLDAVPSWEQRSTLVDPATIGKLPLRRAGWRDGYPYRRFAGEVDGVQWDVTLRVDLMLATIVERQYNGLHERIELTDIYLLAEAPWVPKSSVGYEIIDFADLGDRASEPVVMQLERRLGLATHTH